MGFFRYFIIFTRFLSLKAAFVEGTKRSFLKWWTLNFYFSSFDFWTVQNTTFSARKLYTWFDLLERRWIIERIKRSLLKWWTLNFYFPVYNLIFEQFKTPIPWQGSSINDVTSLNKDELYFERIKRSFLNDEPWIFTFPVPNLIFEQFKHHFLSKEAVYMI